MTTDRGRSRSGARWGWLPTTLGMGLALAANSWANYRSARDAVSTIDLGQAGVFENVARNAIRRIEPDGSLPDLDSLVAAHADAGLRFVGLFESDQGLLNELGGTRLPDPVRPPRFDRGPVPVRIGDRIRVFVPGPRPMERDRSDPRVRGGPPESSDPEADPGFPGRPDRSGHPAPDTIPGPPPLPEADSTAAPPGRGGPEPGVPPGPRTGPDLQARLDEAFRTSIVIEFEPLVAGRLLARATRSLVLGVVAAALLMLTAGLFWRATLRQEADERLMEEQRRLSTLGELSAVLAHEIRNPLASLKGHAQLLAERTPEDSPEQQRVGRIVTEAQRLEELTTDLLDFVRTGPLDLAPVELADLLAGVVSEARCDTARLDTTGAPENWSLDVKRMRQVLVNLLENAVEASPDGAPVDVKAAKEGAALVIAVRDQGEGITDENLGQIFEPFFTTRTKGTGLGLAVARRIVELHGGTLTAHSVSDGGAEFRVILPERKA